MSLNKIMFEEKFFEAEYREGFYIEGMMKRAWAAQMEMLMRIDEVCRKYNIEYFADWGTLLGAVRHKGFIPWDDDIDIAMKRSELNRFLAIAEKELPKGYLLLNVQKEPAYKQLFTRVVNRRQISFEEADLKMNHGCPYVIGIDMFPLDHMPDDPMEAEAHRQMLEALILLADRCDEAGKELEIQIKSIEEMCGVIFDRAHNLRNQILILADRVAQLYNKENTEQLTLMPYWVTKPSFSVKKEWYEERVWLPFENILLPAPRFYEKALTAMYGNWQKPIRNMQDHEYPFYKGQQKILEERRGIQ